MAKKKVAEYWEEIFEEYNILEYLKANDFFKITAEQIKKYNEPRLMVKFDFSKARPKIFKDHDLSILPVANGVYLIGHFDLYQNLPSNDKEPIELSFPSYIQSIDPDSIYSESNALHVGLLTGMLEKSIGESLKQTISGRMRASGFDFEVNSNVAEKNIEIHVEKPQIEIDGGYEGEFNLVIVEAKNQKSEDFIVRQLFYPYTYWRSKVTKKIIPVFFIYDSGIYTVYIYEFADEKSYNSIELRSYENYIVKVESGDSIKKEIYNEIKLIEELPQKTTPFPQADSFTRVLEIIQNIEELNTANKISEYFSFDGRQGSYYLSACYYLGLVKKSDVRGIYELTQFGVKVTKSDVKTRNRLLICKILEHKIFNDTYKFYIAEGKFLGKNEIKKIIDINIPELKKVSERRSSTVRAWVFWIAGSIV